MGKAKKGLPLVAAMVLSVGLVACLPEGESLDRSTGLTQIESKANAMASGATQFSLQLQNIIMGSDMWRTNQLPEGSFAALTVQDQINLGLNNLTAFSSGEMGAGYCDLDSSNNSENNALVTWFENPGGGDFVVKGLGDDASSYIIQALSDSMAPENIGVNSGTTVNLAGPRASNSSKSVDLSRCNLGIPDNVPVVFFEQINRNLSAVGTNAVLVYETETKDCPGGDIGSITERTAYLYDPFTGQKAPSGNPPQIISTCAGASATLSSNLVQNRSADVMSAMMGSMQANNMSAGDLAAALGDLQNIDCKETSGGVLDQDPNLNGNNNNAQPQGTVIETCDTSGIGGGVTMVREITLGNMGPPITTMSATVNCNSGTMQPFAASALGVNGNATPLETWQGTVEFDRNVEGAQATGMQNANASTTVGMRATWQPGDVNCSRREELHLTCGQMFPQYSGSNFTLVSGGGATFERTNTVTSWADRVNYTLDTGMAPNQGWTMTSSGIDCTWLERQTFNNCPSGFSATVTGVMERDINVTGNTLSALTISNFRSVTASQCSRTTQSGSQCP